MLVIKIVMKSRDQTQVSVCVCVFPLCTLRQGIGKCDCLYTRALLDLCQCSADYGPWRFISLSFFFTLLFSPVVHSFFFSGHLLRRVVQGQSKTLVRLSGEPSAV